MLRLFGAVIRLAWRDMPQRTRQCRQDHDTQVALERGHTVRHAYTGVQCAITFIGRIQVRGVGPWRTEGDQSTLEELLRED